MQTRPDAELSQLADAGRLFHSRGWVPGTGGNFSVRVDGRVYVTASGTHKGELRLDDFVEVSAGGEVVGGERAASAETWLHLQRYAFDAGTGAVLHTHSVASTLLSMRQDGISLQGYELLKILEGVDTHMSEVRIPVFDNDQDIPRLAAEVDAAMKRGEGLHGYLIRGHGLYAWGRNAAQARYRVEALEFLMECEWRARS